MAAPLILAAGFAAAASPDALVLECGKTKMTLPVREHRGEAWVLFRGGDLAAPGNPMRFQPGFPYATLVWGDCSVRLAVGVGRACRTGPEGSDMIWISGAPCVIDGAFALPVTAFACVLGHMGASPAWIAAGRHLKVTLEKVPPVSPPSGAPAAVVKKPMSAPASPAATLSTPGVDAGAPASPPSGAPSAKPPEKSEPFHIVLDPGHGGADCGAYGRSKLCEKVVTLDLCRRIAAILKKSRIRVTMTRDSDKYVSLEKRVEIVRRADADLFLSVHVNASRDRRAHGVETYVYGRTVKNAANAALVRRENADANYVDIIVSDLNEQQYHDASIRYAGYIEDQLVRRNKLYGRAQQRVQEAPFYVLARARQPAVLIEVGFISNAKEERKLRSPTYRSQLAETIADGLMQVNSAQARK